MQHQYQHDEEQMAVELVKLESSGGMDQVCSAGAFTELGNDQVTLDRKARTQESLEAQHEHESYRSEFESECDSLTPSPSPMHLPMSSLDYNDDCESSIHHINSVEDPTISNESSDPVDHDHDDDGNDDGDGDDTAYQHAFRKTCRYLNVAMICLCLVGALLRPMEDKIARRTVSSSQRPLGLQFGAHLGRLSNGIHEFYHSGRLRLLDDNNNNNNNNNNNQNQNENNNNDDGDDKQGDDNQNNNNNGDDQAAAENYYNASEVEVDDAYYYNASMANSSYYEEEEEYYYVAPIDDFYNYVEDDDFIERRVFPMEISDYVGFVCVALSIILSIGGGIGPGAILVAVYIIVMDFPPKVAIPLSCVTGLGVNTTGNILNARKRHPLSNRPIIDWDLILVMEPVILLGAIIGTYVNKMLEGKILIVMLVLLLSVIAHNTLKKARRMHHAEELYIKRIMWAKQKRLNVQAPSTSPVYPGSFDNKLAEADPPFVPRVHSLHNDSKSVTSPHKAKNSKRHPLLQSSKSKSYRDRDKDKGDGDSRSNSSFSSSFNSFIILRKEDAESVKSSLVEEDADPLPQHKITYIITMFFFVIGVNVLKGGIAFESPLGITCGSFGFWLMEFMMACWLIFCTMLAGRYLLRRHAIKEAVGYDYVRGDIKWDVRTVIIYPSACLISGVLSGMFGVGVAIFVGPMLVGIGVNPAVASATCACMNFFTSLAAVSSYVVLGSIIPDREYAIALFLLGVVSGYLGSIFTQKAKSTTKIENNKRLERHSYMAYSMGVVVLVSALSMTLEALLDVINHSFDEDEVDGVCQMERMY